MPNYNVPNSTRYHRQLPLLPKHTQPNRWWDFYLSPSPRLITIYTSCKRGQNRGHYTKSHNRVIICLSKYILINSNVYLTYHVYSSFHCVLLADCIVKWWCLLTLSLCISSRLYTYSAMWQALETQNPLCNFHPL